jgi:flagellar protein FliS
MHYPQRHDALRQYRQIKNECAVDGADPNQLVLMLLDGALTRLAVARGHLQRAEIGPKGEQISRALGIISGLRASLNKDAGGDLAHNLDNLYDYMEHRLLAGNAHNDAAALDEVVHLLGEIKGAWDTLTRAAREAKTDLPAAAG